MNRDHEPHRPHKYSKLFALFVHPDVYFQSQREGEDVILMLRAHPITNLGWIINSLFFVICLVLVNVVLPTIISTAFTARYLLFISILGFILIATYAWVNFITWFFNVGIVTRLRIIDLDYSGILYKEVSHTNLDDVQEITVKTSGFVGTLFNYGNVFVQTAVGHKNIEFLNTPDPHQVSYMLNQIRNKQLT